MNITDDQLKSILAKMLPETITQHACGKYYWIGSTNGFVLDTELLALCSLVEVGLTTTEHYQFRCNLWEETKAEKEGRFGGINGEEHNRRYASATWQQRTSALAELKGVTP